MICLDVFLVHLELHDHRIFYVTLIYVISMEFLLLRRRRPSLVVRSEEKRLFKQARISCEKNELNHRLLEDRRKSLDFRFLQPRIALLFETTTTSTTEETLKCGKHEIPEIFLVVLSLDHKQSLILFKIYRCSTQERSRAASE